MRSKTAGRDNGIWARHDLKTPLFLFQPTKGHRFFCRLAPSFPKYLRQKHRTLPAGTLPAYCTATGGNPVRTGCRHPPSNQRVS